VSKILRVLAASLLVACIMIASFTATAFAGNSYGGPELCDGNPIADHDQHQFGK
jgi:hypothetical protein